MIPSTKHITQNGITGGDVYSDEFERRRIYLTGEINEQSASDICAQINHLASLNDDDVCLIIQSPGGSVSAGMSIYDTMKSCKCDISTVVNGMAASMGAFLAAAGTKGKRYVGANAETMIHQPLGGASGQASDVERAATHIIKIKKKLHTMLAEMTGKSYEQICADCDRDYYLDADEAIAYGLADHIFTGFDD